MVKRVETLQARRNQPSSSLSYNKGLTLKPTHAHVYT